MEARGGSAERLQCAVMDRVIKLFLTASLLSCSCRCSKVRVPKSVTAIKGTCVVVPCSTTSHTYATWYKYQRSGYPPVYSKDTKDIINQFRGRTSLLGNAMQGNCSLKIDNVRQEDGGISVYVWINPHSIYGDYTEIKVLAPSETRISVESTQVEGTLFSAKCTVRHSCPVSPPLLEWLGLSSVSNEVTTTQDSGGLWVSVAHAQFNASRRDHGKRVTCRRMSDGNTATGDALNILYAPTNVNIHTSGTTPVVEGSNISLTCSSDSNPPVASYEWRIIQMNSTIKHKTRSLLIQDVRRDMKISCIADNSIGLGESDQLSLNVHYAPTNVNIHTSGRTPVVEGSNISLTCSSDSNPPVASYEWRIIQMNSTIKHKTRSLLLQDVRRDMKISCIAHNSIGLGESDQLSLNVHYAPTNVNIHTSGTTPVVEGSNISLTCSSDSNPPVASYEWRIIQMNSTIKHKTRSLLLQEVRRDMKISCIAHNSIGLGESDQLSLNVHFPPTILPDSACWEREGSLHCMCWVEAEPNASISWTVDGRSALLPHFNMTNNYAGRTTLSVMAGPPGHFVTCEAANYLGNDTYQMSGFPQLAQGTGYFSLVCRGNRRRTLLLVLKSFPPFFPATVGFTYFILAAIVLIVLGIVVLGVHRRMKKRHEHSRGAKNTRSSENTSQCRQNIESNGTQTKVRQKTYEWHKDDNVYANDVSGGHIWSTAMVTSQAPEDEMASIYLNECYT
ncbi:myelin-associated glycoprotein-like isoform X4 [Electrophorus electricus]|uniref:myelin-associated glycoprotein-like isoform X4 n=1 Tax=Electrophorus electricus TaxID=8005 RepID=UPI0015CFB491|nr:myelin-associated glycoprotein-like isoform X4 [Electrophorus electricus]